MSFLEKIKASLKDKWLDYYQINRFWLKKLPDVVSTPDSGTRPHS